MRLGFLPATVIVLEAMQLAKRGWTLKGEVQVSSDGLLFAEFEGGSDIPKSGIILPDEARRREADRQFDELFRESLKLTS